MPLPTQHDLDFAEDLIGKALNDVDAIGLDVKGLQRGLLDGDPRAQAVDVDEGEVGRFVLFAESIRIVAESLQEEAKKIESAIIDAYRLQHDGLPTPPEHLRATERLAGAYITYADERLSYARSRFNA